MSIVVNIISANLTHDTDWIDKMDPYCKIYFGGQEWKTKVCKNGGKQPIWNESKTFNSATDSILRIEVWDSDTLIDDPIGQGQYNLMKVYGIPAMRSNSQYVDLTYQSKAAGRLLIGIQLVNMGGVWGQQFGGQQFGGQQQFGNDWGNNNNGGFGGNGWNNNNNTNNFNNNGW